MRTLIRQGIAKTLSPVFPFLRSLDVQISAIIGRVHEDEFQELNGLIPVNGLILDIGSNLGQSVTSLSVVCKTPTIVSFECNTLCFPTLSKVGRINHIMRGIQFSHQYSGLGAEAGSYEFMIPCFNGIQFLQEGFLEGTSIDKESICSRIGCSTKEISFDRVKVSINKLDDFNYKPNLIKIDVQGAEIDVLKGSYDTIKNFKPILFIEIPDDKTLKNELTSFLRNDFNYNIRYLETNLIGFPAI